MPCGQPDADAGGDGLNSGKAVDAVQEVVEVDGRDDLLRFSVFGDSRTKARRWSNSRSSLTAGAVLLS